MFKPVKLAAIAASFLCFSGVIPAAVAQVGPATATKLVFYNASNADVAVALQVPTCPAPPTPCVQEDGCPTGSIQTLKTIDLTAHGRPTALVQFGAASKGWFMLKRGHRVQLFNSGINKYTGKPSYCLQGLNFGFGSFEAICPDSTAVPPNVLSTFPVTVPGPKYNTAVPVSEPNGTTGFEATLNLTGTVNGQSVNANPSPPPPTVGVPTGEAMNITCVNGANCTLNVQAIPPATGPFWQSDGSTQTYRSTVSFQNSWVDIINKCDNNCVDPKTGLARPGVYPYGCTECNENPDQDPPCTGNGLASAQFCAARNLLPAKNGCKFTRNPKVAGVQSFGGTVQVNYYGPLRPPGTCPPGSR